jgi:hypothetical protein
MTLVCIKLFEPKDEVILAFKDDEKLAEYAICNFENLNMQYPSKMIEYAISFKDD